MSLGISRWWKGGHVVLGVSESPRNEACFDDLFLEVEAVAKMRVVDRERHVVYIHWKAFLWREVGFGVNGFLRMNL